MQPILNPDLAFQQALSTSVARGWEARHVDPATRTAVLYSPPGEVNHTAHILGVFLTCGLWLPVWVIVAMSAPGAKSMTLTVDEAGQPHFSKPLPPGKAG